MNISKEEFLIVLKKLEKNNLIYHYFSSNFGEKNNIKVINRYNDNYTFYFDKNDKMINPEVIEMQEQVKQLQKQLKKLKKSIF